MDIKKLFNLDDERLEKKEEVLTAAEKFAKILEEMNGKNESPTGADFKKAFEDKYGDVEEFVMNGMDELSEDITIQLIDALHVILEKVGEKHNPMVLMHSIVLLMKHLFTDVLEAQTDNATDIQRLQLGAAAKSMIISKKLSSESPGESMETILACMAIMALNLTHLTIESEGIRAYEEQNK